MASTTTGGFDLLHDTLTVPPVHIPDGNGSAYKTELVLERTPERTVKILWWHADDPRDMPHNHPWDFESEILVGGYWEERWEQVETATGFEYVRMADQYHCEGTVNRVPRGVFHNVRSVEPGTVTRMTCGPAVAGNAWHYLDTATGTLIDPTDVNIDFVENLREINPHLRYGDGRDRSA